MTFDRIAGMENDAAPQIVALDRINHGLLVYFNNGRQGFFPDALLYSILDRPEGFCRQEGDWPGQESS